MIEITIGFSTTFFMYIIYSSMMSSRWDGKDVLDDLLLLFLINKSVLWMYMT